MLKIAAVVFQRSEYLAIYPAEECAPGQQVTVGKLRFLADKYDVSVGQCCFETNSSHC
jgi:hypothetical protein